MSLFLKEAVSNAMVDAKILKRLKDLDAVTNPTLARSLVRSVFNKNLKSKHPVDLLDKTTKQISNINMFKSAELLSIVKEAVTQKEKSHSQVTKSLIDLGAGGIAGGASGLAVAPLATVADIAGTNAKSVGDSFYGMKPKQIAKVLYDRGSVAAGAVGKNKILGGIKEFYGGQGLKTLKMLPQNALNLALFSALTGAVSKNLIDKK